MSLSVFTFNRHNNQTPYMQNSYNKTN